MKRSVKILLTLSVLLNVILLGLMGGGAYRLISHFGTERALQKELSSLSAEIRDEIDDAFQESREEMKGLMRAMRKARQDVRASLNADPFIEDDYTAAAQKMNDLKRRIMQVRTEKTGKIARSLTAADRRNFAGYLMRGNRKGGFREAPPEPRPPQKNAISPPPKPQTETRVKPVQDDPFDPVMLPMPEFE